MKRKSVIVLENTNPKAFDDKIECFGNFKKMCLEKEFPYHSLKMFKFPITYKDSVIYKVEFKQQVTFCGFVMVAENTTPILNLSLGKLM